jgi:hypothetical protein
VGEVQNPNGDQHKVTAREMHLAVCFQDGGQASFFLREIHFPRSLFVRGKFCQFSLILVVERDNNTLPLAVFWG